MAYEDFLTELAAVQGVGTREALLNEHAARYAFQINSRERARSLIRTLGDKLGLDFAGLRILDVGCAYGGFSIEASKAKAHVVGVDLSAKWLKLAEANARDEAEVRFLKGDASTHAVYEALKESGPFDLFVVNDVFEHIYDTVGLMQNIARLSSPGAMLYYKIPNGQATRNVLSEGHKKVFGVSLLAPDFWTGFVSLPFGVYYRRWAYFQAIFDAFGFSSATSFNAVGDPDLETTRRFIVKDLNRIRRHLQPENFDDAAQFVQIRTAAKSYYDEAKHDLETMAWEALFLKYRVNFWEGAVARPGRRA